MGKLYFSAVAMILILSILLIFVLPFLFSANDWTLVGMGTGIVIVLPPLGWVALTKLRNIATQSFKGECNDNKPV